VATSRLALTGLATGPSPVEAAAGLATGIPAGTRFDIADVTGGVATVAFDPAFTPAGGTRSRLRQAQVVYTLTQFPTVSKVGLQSGGEPVEPVRRAAGIQPGDRGGHRRPVRDIVKDLAQPCRRQRLAPLWTFEHDEQVAGAGIGRPSGVQIGRHRGPELFSAYFLIVRFLGEVLAPFRINEWARAALLHLGT
jgi:Sporulation and spore germination